MRVLEERREREGIDRRLRFVDRIPIRVNEADCVGGGSCGDGISKSCSSPTVMSTSSPTSITKEQKSVYLPLMHAMPEPLLHLMTDGYALLFRLEGV